MSELAQGFSEFWDDQSDAEKADIAQAIADHMHEERFTHAIVRWMLEKNSNTPSNASADWFVESINHIAENSNDFENWKNGIEKKQPVVFDKAS